MESGREHAVPGWRLLRRRLKRGERQTEQPAAFDQCSRLVMLQCRPIRRDLVFQPGRQQRPIIVPGEVERQPAIGAGEQPAAAAGRDGALPVEPGDGGALAQQLRAVEGEARTREGAECPERAGCAGSNRHRADLRRSLGRAGQRHGAAFGPGDGRMPIILRHASGAAQIGEEMARIGGLIHAFASIPCCVLFRRGRHFPAR